MNSFVYDGYGQKYGVELVAVAPEWIFRVWHDSARVGDASVGITGPLLWLKDIRVSDCVLYPEKQFVLWLRHVTRCSQKPISYRARGIGSALLSLIVDWATEQRLTGVVGDVSPENLVANPHLLSWFAHRGFSYREGGRFGLGQVIRTLTQRFSERPIGAHVAPESRPSPFGPATFAFSNATRSSGGISSSE